MVTPMLACNGKLDDDLFVETVHCTVSTRWSFLQRISADFRENRPKFEFIRANSLQIHKS
jgi:hypothetical protein